MQKTLAKSGIEDVILCDESAWWVFAYIDVFKTWIIKWRLSRFGVSPTVCSYVFKT